MTISATNTLNGPFSPNGSTTQFPFTFAAMSAAEIAVVRVTSTGAQTTLSGWTATCGPSGGTVTFSAAPAAGDPIYVLPDPSFTQQVELENQGAFLPAVIETAFDRAAARDIALKGKIDRSIKVPVGSVAPAWSEFLSTLPRGPAGTLTNNSGVVTNVPISVLPTTPNFGWDVVLPGSASGYDAGIRMTEGTVGGSGRADSFITLIKNRLSGGDFMRLVEYVPQYVGLPGYSEWTAATYFSDSAVLTTRKSILISATFQLGSYPDARDPRHDTVLLPPSPAPSMLAGWADVPIFGQTRLPDSTPDNANKAQTHWSYMGLGGREKLRIAKEGFFQAMDGWVPTATYETDAASHIRSSFGPRGRKTWSPFDGGITGIPTIAYADLATINSPDATSEFKAQVSGTPGFAGMFWCPDAPSPGIYVSNGEQFALISAVSATVIGPNTLSWTPSAYAFAGRGTVITQTATRDFSKTAGGSSWDAAENAPAASGNQRWEFVVNDTTHSIAFGFCENSVVTSTGDDLWKAAQSKLTGIMLTNTGVIPIDRGTSPTAGVPTYSGIVAGDRITLDRIGTTVNIYVNSDILVGSASTTLPAGSVTPSVQFLEVGGKAKNIRWRAL